MLRGLAPDGAAACFKPSNAVTLLTEVQVVSGGHNSHGEQREDREEGEAGDAAYPLLFVRGAAADGHRVRGVVGLEAALFSMGVLVLSSVGRVSRDGRARIHRRRRDGFWVRAGLGGVVLHAVGLDDFGGVIGAPVRVWMRRRGIVRFVGSVGVPVLFRWTVHGWIEGKAISPDERSRVDGGTDQNNATKSKVATILRQEEK
ncbi:hypothetical protein PG997_000183 [Apiospora hydei]|uniref:Uncharacterized protein n=1 Tax=Apiospora hydei TaxID=1337664 RepID=A0ABR1XA74_9PEZI